MPQKTSAAKRLRILERDGFLCFYCGCELHLNDLSWGSANQPEHGNYGYLDHVNPRAGGGLHTDDNLVAACRPCNSSKGKRDLEAFRQAMMARQPHMQAARFVQLALQQMPSAVAPQLQEALAWFQTQPTQTLFPGEVRRSALRQAVVT